MDPGGFHPVTTMTSENQPMIAGRQRPVFRIALPAWRFPRRAVHEKQEPEGVTRDEIASIFGNDLVASKISRMTLTKSERQQLDTNEKLRSALYSF